MRFTFPGTARWRLVRVILAVAVATMCSRVHAQSDDEAEEPAPIRPSDRVELNLDGGDLGDLVRTMNRITGRSFVVTGTLRQLAASITSSAPVTVAEAYRAFLAILHQNGLTVVRRGRHYHVVPTEGIGPAPTQIVGAGDVIPIDERFITWIHHVEHVPVGDAAQVLETLRSPDGQLVTYAPTQTLILVDTGANVRRMQRILAEVDVARGDVHVWVEPIHFGDATAIAEQLRELFAPEAREAAAPARPNAPPSGAETGAPRTTELHRVIPEPRTNKLILVATEAGYLQVIALLREIDRPDGAEATVRVHRLQHGDAAAVATTLQALLSAGSGPNAQAQTSIEGLRGRVRVEAHADLNALVITSSPADYRVLSNLIADLDAAPRQVFLEMVLMELSTEHNDELGANLISGLAGLFGPGTLGLIGGGGGADLAGDLLSGLNLAGTGPNIPGTSTPTFGMLIHALARSNQADILSTPSILVLDNREAVINVGQNVPLQGSSVPGMPSLLSAMTSQQTQDTTALSTAMSQSSTPARRDTGTIVHVLPHINDDGEIRLEIQVEDSRTGDVAAGNLGAVALQQSIAETELVVRDGHTVAIGGLVRESVETRESGVPVLSDIPLIGALFGRHDRHTVRRNLVFFVTPYIVRTPSDMRAITERRMRERREFMDRHMVFEGDWEPAVDYSRTRGVVCEILDTIERIDAETELASAQAAAVVDRHVPAPPIDLE